jgi:hypothetical protein
MLLRCLTFSGQSSTGWIPHEGKRLIRSGQTQKYTVFRHIHDQNRWAIYCDDPSNTGKSWIKCDLEKLDVAACISDMSFAG